MEIAATGEATVSFFACTVINDLRLRAQKKHNKHVILSCIRMTDV